MSTTSKAEGLKGARVLVMEDEFIVAMALEALLEEMGCEVVGPFATVSAGIEVAGASRLDAAVLDVNLRDGIVSPIAERLRARGVPVILHTACATASALPPPLDSFDRVSKPSSEADLRTHLLALLARSRPDPAAA